MALQRAPILEQPLVKAWIVSFGAHFVLVGCLLLHPSDPKTLSLIDEYWWYSCPIFPVALPVYPRLILPSHDLPGPNDAPAGDELGFSGAPVAALIVDDDVRDMVERHEQELTSCYAWPENLPPNAQGVVAAKWSIGQRGRVSGVGVVVTTLPDEIGECIVREIRRWRFSSQQERREVSFRFRFMLASRAWP